MTNIQEIRDDLMNVVVPGVKSESSNDNAYLRLDPEFKKRMAEKYGNVRLIPEHSLITMDYRPDRLNIGFQQVGENFVITRVYYG